MKRILPVPLLLAAMALLHLPGCMKDTCRNTYKIYSPVFKTLAAVRADMKSSQPQPLKNPGKLYVFGNYIFLNDVNRGIHVIDNSNPASPLPVSFIHIPRNEDLAVKGNYLYADSFSDIVVFDISDPQDVKAVHFMNNVIRDKNQYWTTAQSNPDLINVIVDYTERDTTVDCQTYNAWLGSGPITTAGGNVFTAAMPQTGVGGSMARFAIRNDFLYAVSNSQLFSINISSPASPQLSGTNNVGFGIETIYPFRDKLFIGSRTGMFIYDVANPSAPAAQGQFNHARSCDPVIADGQFAYVTLRSGTFCDGFANQMDIVDITNLSSPSLRKTYSMTNPHGLSKDNDLLFICDGSDGLRIFDASDVDDLKPVKIFSGLNTYDIITLNGIAILVAQDGLYQFDYSNPADIRQVSRIPIIK